MKERPILFSGPMVRAILAGRKTQTRRIVKMDSEILTSGFGGPDWYHPTVVRRNGEEEPGPETFGIWCPDGEWGFPCPFGGPGDRLWVKETFFPTENPVSGEPATYRAGCTEIARRIIEGGSGWKPSIFMPRHASRITLCLFAVRVERLQEISEEDAIAEGIFWCESMEGFVADEDGRCFHGSSAKRAFENLWGWVNGPESWGENPWVWVNEIKRINP